MLKQILSVSLVLIVSVILLGHGMIPHHHHADVPCFTAKHSHCCCPEKQSAACNDDHKDTCPHNHQQPEKGSCGLEMLIIAPVNDSHNNPFAITHHQSTDHLLQAVLIAILYDFSIPEKDVPVREFPCLTTYYTAFAARALGLRAPPFGA